MDETQTTFVLNKSESILRKTLKYESLQFADLQQVTGGMNTEIC